MKKKGILIGIAGGSGSGKTLVAETIYKDLGSDQVILLKQDSYYKDLSHLPLEKRHEKNFDHPDAIDSELFIAQVKDLLAGRTIEEPVYNFVTHSRSKETKTVGPHSMIVLDGILIFDNVELRNLMDIKVYVDTDPDIRVIRRLKRDIIERGRSLESVIEQYEQSVRPMHLQFVEPSKRYADIIVPEGGYNKVAIDLIKTKIEALLNE